MTSFLFGAKSNLYLDKNGDVIKVGTKVVDRELAATLAIIRDAPNDFYAGDLAAKIVRDVKEAGGDISFDDLQNYKVNCLYESGFQCHFIYFMSPWSNGH